MTSSTSRGGLRSLTLWGNELGDEGLLRLLDATFAPSLEALDVADNQLTAASLRQAERLPALTSLITRGNAAG